MAPATDNRSLAESRTPTQVVTAVLDAIELSDRPEAWVYVTPREVLLERARELEMTGPAGLPLYAVPFAVKDNIDIAGMPTSAGCPAFSYVADRTAPAVQRLLAAGAILVGKTHMDQFATGLVGTRSPLGPCRNAHHPEYIAGGSSSGSAVVVAQGLVHFALGTDTAGSGRVPAVLNGVVGLKPTRGRIDTDGVVPACVSLDCVSVFAPTCAEAERILDVLSAKPPAPAPRVSSFRFATPTGTALLMLDAEARDLFEAAAAALESIGGQRVEIDYTPFQQTAELLYSRGAWLVERDRSFGAFLRARPEACDPTVAAIVSGAAVITSVDVEHSLQALERMKAATAPIRASFDVLVVPTVPRLFRIDEVMAHPLDASPKIGVFNNFANLLGMAAVAVPTGTWSCGVPFGVTLCSEANSERRLLRIGGALEACVRDRIPRLMPPARIELAVVGAHLRGMPLHHELTERGARLVAATTTSPDYRLYALANTTPPKPGLRRVSTGGAAIEVEVWSLRPQAFATFVAAVPRPLAIGRITLAGGREVSGFVCEPEALEGAEDITHHRGWRAYQHGVRS